MTSEHNASAALDAAREATEQALQTASAQESGTALVPTGTDAALAVKTQMATAHASVANAHAAAVAKVNAAREAIRLQQAELDRQARALEQEMAPLVERLKIMKEGIWTMNLYLGRDEEVVQIADGQPAPEGTPIHVRQLVLAMDEESALNAETGGIDYRSVEAFDRWITSNPEHLHQVLPEARGVVAIMARRTDVDYGNALVSGAANEANHHTYFLIRNGDLLYRMDTDFNVGRRLVPARNEFTSMFTVHGKQLEPGTREWLQAEKSASARERHFMRIALILQGLIDRTHVFHPLPKAGVSLLTPEDYDNGHVVLIADDENQLTTGRVGFYQWIASLNSQLRPGMRVLINTCHTDWPSAGRERHDYDKHPRINPPRAEYPASNVPHVIKRAGRHAGEFVVTYARTHEEWIGSGYGAELRVPKTPASVTIKTTDMFVLPLDLVDVATMRTYLGARTERHAYLDMFPTLRAAIELKEAEAAAEAPFRDLLAATIAQREDISLDAAHAAIDPVIATWKVGAKWFRALGGDPATEARAAKAILAERARIVAANAGAGDDTAFLAKAKADHPDALLIARKKNGTYVVLTPARTGWLNPKGKAHRHLRTDVWVHQREYTRTGALRSVTEWVIPTMATVSRWIILETSDAWSRWDKTARAVDHLTDHQVREAIETIRTTTYEGMNLVMISFEVKARWGGGMLLQFRGHYHPDEVVVSDRPLTKEAPWHRGFESTATAEVQPDGSLTLDWRYDAPVEDDYWSPPFNWGLQPLTTERPKAPWHHDRADAVYVDDDAMAVAHAQGALWEKGRHHAAVLSAEATLCFSAIANQWIEAALAAEKARFLEDYADPALWEEAKDQARRSLKLPWEQGHADCPQWIALTHLIDRLVETDRTPWELTVEQAHDLLGEEIDDLPASVSQYVFAKQP